MLNHRKARKVHAIARLKERHGVVSSDGKVLEHLKKMIQHGINARKVRLQNFAQDKNSIWVLKVADKYIPIVYDELRNNIVTALPKSFLDHIDLRLYRS